MADAQAPKVEGQSNTLGCVLRMFWMLAGNAIPMFTAIWIAKARVPWGSVADLLFWSAIVSLVLARYLDVAYFHGTTSTGEPATMAHWRKHALLAVVLGGVVWLAAHGIGMLSAR
jgi:hypothetical protein